MKKIKLSVKETYAAIAKNQQASCCGGDRAKFEHELSIGYERAELYRIPEGAVLGVGCGNPVALASLEPGEHVLDLGAGAGLDVFLAAERVGPEGQVVGVDMTDEMLERARINAENGGYKNVEFIKGEIEDMPVSSGRFDCVISNCVINLSVDKDRTFAESFRALKPGGRLMVSDIVLTKDLPKEVVESVEAYTGCVAGAVHKAEYLDAIMRAGFTNVEVISIDDASFLTKTTCGCGIVTGDNVADLGVVSIKVRAYKPESAIHIPLM